jgi:hypothetical protein
MKSMSKATRAAVLLALLFLCTSEARADIGLPMVALYLPPAWLCFIPIVVIEAALGILRFKVPAHRAFVAQAVANALTTLIGIPVTWAALAVMEFRCCGGASGLASPMARVYAVTIQAPWLIPYESDLHWMVPAAFVVLTIPFCAMSIVFEYVVVRQFFRHLPKQTIWGWVTRANGLSYAFLIMVMFASTFWPSGVEWTYALFEPVTHALIGVVYWIIRGQPLPF